MKKKATNELEEYVREALEAIGKGVAAGKGRVEGTIDFDVAVTSTREGSGGFKIYVATLGSNIKREKVTRLHFKVRPGQSVSKLSKIVDLKKK
ncbi:MAG: hypothetical protein A3I39_01645 [Candidatus Yanofskybacteria bacterium RIFCSPLOWO2_02_FULL_47_9b]|uniref:Uncharacterized protein n=1 Tax=Candidatus Yanofskybacteria bacterium RIFCSPLOWO2_02_FULL_47_9b TaxID=1802708 RepID=A0A1F8HAV8_9BACT|nr:MAG: hypothetical protein A3I39_01645 [Candidatus Yanofskybacteria bacterium RIFCSPLOWO2_02_FULL_47_9b]